MCETDKAKFVDESEKVKTTIRKMSAPLDLTPLAKFELTEALDQYVADVGAIDMGDMTDAEMSTAKSMLTRLESDIAEAMESAQKNGEAAAALKQTLIK